MPKRPLIGSSGGRTLKRLIVAWTPANDRLSRASAYPPHELLPTSVYHFIRRSPSSGPRQVKTSSVRSAYGACVAQPHTPFHVYLAPLPFQMLAMPHGFVWFSMSCPTRNWSP
jgi:hypothetical protein